MVSFTQKARTFVAKLFERSSDLSKAITSPSITDAEIDRWFKSAAKKGCWITSCADDVYNCIAWAAGDIDNWWWPDRVSGCYGPDGVPEERTVSAFVKAFAAIGYKEWSWRRRGNGRLHPEYEKIAIYVDATGKPTHAARQLENGRWVSKLGPYKDVQHASPSTLEGTEAEEYGIVVKYLWRRRRPAPAVPQRVPGCAKTCTSICGELRTLKSIG
jgi:hypothetical protein